MKKSLPESLRNWDIILGSGSPRRQKLLTDLGLKYRVITVEISEDYPPDIEEEDIALFIARKKASYLADNLKASELLITADTIVWSADYGVLGKPEGYKDAKATLVKLSGREHEVITAVCIRSLQAEKCFSSCTKVSFVKLEEKEIDYYLMNFHPYDKAGAYGIQEWIGMIGVDHIEGSYFNVMGLPVQMLYKNLKEFIRQSNINK